jgi:hypothetical protein
MLCFTMSRLKKLIHHPTWSWNKIQHLTNCTKPIDSCFIENQAWTHDKDTNIRRQPNTGLVQFHSMWLAGDVFGKREETMCWHLPPPSLCMICLSKRNLSFPLGPGILCPKGYIFHHALQPWCFLQVCHVADEVVIIHKMI